MTTADFRSLLDKRADDIKRPPVLPPGTYFGRLGKRTFEEIGKNKTPAVRWPVAITSAHESIDPSLLEGIDLTKRQFRHAFFVTPDAEWRLVEFLTSLGIAKEGRTTGEMVEDSEGKEVVLELLVKPNQNNPEETFNEIKTIKGVNASA